MNKPQPTRMQKKFLKHLLRDGTDFDWLASAEAVGYKQISQSVTKLKRSAAVRERIALWLNRQGFDSVRIIARLCDIAYGRADHKRYSGAQELAALRKLADLLGNERIRVEALGGKQEAGLEVEKDSGSPPKKDETPAPVFELPDIDRPQSRLPPFPGSPDLDELLFNTRQGQGEDEPDAKKV